LVVAGVGISVDEVNFTMAFIAVVAALIGVVGTLLWFTGWAEQRVVSEETKPVEAKTR